MKVCFVALGLAIGIMWIAFISRSCVSTQNAPRGIQQPPTVVRVYSPNAHAASIASPQGQSSLHGMLYAGLIFLAIDLGFWLWARHSVKSICKREDKSADEKLEAIANEDILFDLPLYAGLMGTVVGFMLISMGFSFSRDVAYVSTVIGIIASAGMRIAILRPVRRRLQDAL